MSYLFDGVDDSLSIDSAVKATTPFTMAAWFKTTDLALSQDLVSMVDKDVATHYQRLFFAGAVAGDPIRADGRAGSGGTTQSAATTTAPGTGVWHHACGVFTGASARAVFLDGAGKGTNTGSVTVTGLDRTSIGRLMWSAPTQPMAGRIAEVAIWDIALSDAEVASLAVPGTDPATVRPDALVAVWHLRDDALDSFGSNHLTVNGATLDADNPWSLGGGGTDLTVDAPPFQVTAEAASFTYHPTVDPDPFEVTAEFLAPTVTRDRTVDAPPFEVTAEAALPSIAAGSELTVAVPPFEVTADFAAPALERDLTVVPPAFEVVAEGPVPALALQRALTVVVPPFDVAVSGAAPEVDTVAAVIVSLTLAATLAHNLELEAGVQ